MATQESMGIDVVEPLHGFPKPDEPQGGPAPRPRAPRDVEVRLELGYATHRIGADDVKLRSYNGRLGGPVIDAVPGDTLNVTLVNGLPLGPTDGGTHPPDEPHGFNTTNLHYHGLHVSPTGNSDNVMLEIEPTHHFHYEVKIPLNHPAGTFWYHAHKHGSGAIQLGNGLAGALIIRGDLDRVPAIRAARERIILLQQIPYTLTDDPTAPGQRANMVESYDVFGPGAWQQLGRRFTLNGVVEPTYELCPGEVQHWRFIHGGLREGLQLRVVERQGDQETPWTQFQLAHDGLTTGRLDEVTMTEIHPGYREDMLVRATSAEGKPLRPGIYFLVDDLATGPAHTLARIVVRGPPQRMFLPRPQELAPLAPFAPITDAEVQGRPVQEAHFQIDTSVTPPLFLINGKPFDPDNVRKLELGAADEWEVSAVNFAHPFHIHVNPFQVLTGDGKSLWRDTLLLRAGQPQRLRTRYDRYIGMFMLHCHILDHADLGMAEHVEVVASGGEHPHSAVH